jgi:excisionase family DNA binding protein
MKGLDAVVSPLESEKPKLEKMRGVFHLNREIPSSQAEMDIPQLVGPGFAMELPESVFDALCQIVYYMLQGRAVSIIPVNKEITTQEAADFLNVSRPYLVKLLEQGDIPFVKVGTHRRIRFSDMLEYKQRRDETRKQGLSEITHIAEDTGFYD